MHFTLVMDLGISMLVMVSILLEHVHQFIACEHQFFL